jgi:predicted amidohydrolase YtcJ
MALRQMLNSAWHRSGALLAVLLIINLSAARAQPADTVLRNGKIVTMDRTKPSAEALAIQGDTILAVGSNQEVQGHIGKSTQVIDLAGKLAIPGFIEGHGHLTGLGSARMSLNLMTVNNWDQVVSMVAESVTRAQPGEWILGRGWHQEKWNKKPAPSVEGFPTHESISKVSPDNPVLLTHASGHAAFANARALALAGINKNTPNPPGGEILRDTQGRPTGVLRETAAGLVSKALAEARSRRSPEQIQAQARKEIELAIQECLAKGVTSFQDAGSSFATIDLLKKLAEEGRLGVRLWVMVRETNASLAENLARYRWINSAGKRLTVRAIKKSIDGALGPRGAWLLEPYSDLPSSTGLNTTPVGELAETARLAVENGFQLCVHAIGDRANRETLDVFERTFKSHPEKKDLRWRVEHAQHLAAADIARFGQLNVIASMQGIHCTSDAPYVLARLGENRTKQGAYVWQKLMKSGAVVVNGTDAPVEDVSPIASFYASVSRKLNNGSVFFPDQRMSREQALQSYTLNAAYAAFEEDIKGSLSPGKLADITVLSKDIMSVSEDEIPATEVLYTMVGGQVVYRK